LDTEKWKSAYTTYPYGLSGGLYEEEYWYMWQISLLFLFFNRLLEFTAVFFCLRKGKKGGISRFIFFDSEAYSSSYLSSPLSSLKRPKFPVY